MNYGIGELIEGLMVALCIAVVVAVAAVGAIIWMLAT